MNNIIITVEGLLWFLGAIVAVGGATAVIARWLAPFRALKAEVAKKADKCEVDNLSKTIAELKDEITTLQGVQKTDHKELKKIEVGVEKMCKCVFAITDHELTGNSVDKLRNAKEEMETYLIQK